MVNPAGNGRDSLTGRARRTAPELTLLVRRRVRRPQWLAVAERECRFPCFPLSCRALPETEDAHYTNETATRFGGGPSSSDTAHTSHVPIRLTVTHYASLRADPRSGVARHRRACFQAKAGCSLRCSPRDEKFLA